MTFLIVYYLIINLVLFIMTWMDKKRAIKNRWRVPEAYLFIVALMGGSLGGFLGMLTFHHKTKKLYFYFIYFLSFNLHLVFIYMMLGRLLFNV